MLAELERNLLENGKPGRKVRDVMESAFSDAMVLRESYATQIPDMPNDLKDRHVLAAAIACEANVLITANLKHFKALPELCETEIQHPDTFLLQQLNVAPNALLHALKHLVANRKPPMDTVPGILRILHVTTPKFAAQSFDVMGKYIP